MVGFRFCSECNGLAVLKGSFRSRIAAQIHLHVLIVTNGAAKGPHSDQLIFFDKGNGNRIPLEQPVLGASHAA